jgi:hypothetical protein
MRPEHPATLHDPCFQSLPAWSDFAIEPESRASASSTARRVGESPLCQIDFRTAALAGTCGRAGNRPKPDSTHQVREAWVVSQAVERRVTARKNQLNIPLAERPLQRRERAPSLRSTIHTFAKSTTSDPTTSFSNIAGRTTRRSGHARRGCTAGEPDCRRPASRARAGHSSPRSEAGQCPGPSPAHRGRRVGERPRKCRSAKFVQNARRPSRRRFPSTTRSRSWLCGAS